MFIEWLIQFGPLTGFFLVFKASDGNFFAATAVLMALIVVATVASWARSHTLPWFPLWNATFVLVFGSATLYYADPHWLILKDTLYDGLFGLVILIGLAFRKNLLKTFFVPLFAISDRGWHVLAVRWALFFLISAILNDVVRNLFSPAFWVHYKIAHAAASVAFGLLQLRLTGHERFRDEANRLGMRLTHKKDEPR